MKILVTGGGGFLGTYIVKELLKNPTYLVTNFSRHSYEHLENMGVPTIRGDLTRVEDLERALSKGFDAVFHVASKVGMWGTKADFEAINVTGTENLLRLAKQYGVKRVVYTSSPSVVFGRGGHQGADETMPYPTTHLSEYARTKALGEQLVLAANADEFLTCALRPHLIWGPGDQMLVPQVLQKARTGKLKMVGDGENEVDIIYVENAARAHVMAFEALRTGSPVAGQAYFLGQGPIKLWDFVGQLLKRAEIDPLDAQISTKSAYFLGAICEKLWKILGINQPEPPMSRFVALNLGTDHWFSHAKAERDFGWRPTISVSEGLDRLFANRENYRHILGRPLVSLLLPVLFFIGAAHADVTVSGISSGGYFANQFHVAHSATVTGSAIVAGGPYNCSNGELVRATNRCMNVFMGMPTAQESLGYAREQAQRGKIDALTGLATGRAMVVHGQLDGTVDPKVGEVLADFYELAGVKGERLVKIMDIPMGHAWPTLDFGNPCREASRTPYLSNCDRDLAGEILAHLLNRSLKPAVEAKPERLFKIAQGAARDLASWSMGEHAYAYIPAVCEKTPGKCSIHVAFHGCKQTTEDIGRVFVTETGLNGHAEANGIVILYPQAVKNLRMGNPNGCWDWWGYSTKAYALQEAPQIKAVQQLIQTVQTGKARLVRAH